MTSADLTTSFTTVGVANMTAVCLDDYSTDVTQMRLTTDPYPAEAESLATSMAGELERIRYVLKKLSGWSQWYAHTERPALPNFNWTFNGDLEIYGGGTAAVATGWTLTGAGGTAAKNTTAGQFKVGTASLSVTRAGTDVTAHQDIDLIPGFGPVGIWQGKTVTLGMWVRATVASRARVQINDGVGTTSSPYHTGGSALEFLTVTRTLDAAATRVRIQGSVDTGDTTAQFDGAVLVLGNMVPDFLPSGWRGRKSQLTFAGTAGQAAGATQYYGLGGPTATEVEIEYPVSFKFVARKLHVHRSSAPGGTETAVFTVRKSLSDTSPALTATITGAASSTREDTIETAFDAVQGQVIGIKVVTSASAASAFHKASIEIEEIP